MQKHGRKVALYSRKRLLCLWASCLILLFAQACSERGETTALTEFSLDDVGFVGKEVLSTKLSITPERAAVFYWHTEESLPLNLKVKYTVTNTSNASVTWQLNTDQPLLVASKSGGTLGPSESEVVEVALASTATLGKGEYQGTISFSEHEAIITRAWNIIINSDKSASSSTALYRSRVATASQPDM